jgi:DedD protein
MTVRYTAIEGMEDSALRDVDRNAERWRDKIELRLDNRQVFFLFFGSAVVACMLFVLGVMVGKRIESRGQAAAPELQDPLAALDRAHKPAAGVAAPAPQLTFPNTLIAPSARPKSAAAKPPVPAPVAKPVAAPVPVSKAVPAPVPVSKPVAAPVPASVAKAVPALAPQPPKPIIAPAAGPHAPRPIAPVAAPPRPAAPAAAAVSKPGAMAPAADPAKSKGKFTLHLSTFATADEASAFAQRYPGAFVISGEVPGRGMTYRVRYGNFPTFKDATGAKDSFERQHGTIALVAAR